jgi:hypothetical protein
MFGQDFLPCGRQDEDREAIGGRRSIIDRGQAVVGPDCQYVGQLLCRWR